MRVRALRTMLRKELTDTLRDRRTLVATVVLPIVLYPLIFVLMGVVISSNVGRVEGQRPVVAVWGTVPSEVVDTIRRTLEPRIEPRSEHPVDPVEEARRVLAGGEVHLVILGDHDEASAERSLTLTMYSNDVEPLSRSAATRAADALAELNTTMLEQRAAERGLDPGFLRPLEVVELDLATAQQRGGEFAARLIPLLLLIMVTTGASFAAIDVTAGEKERGTMQTLLVAPLRPLEMISAKYLTVLVVAMASAVLNLTGMALAIGRQTASLSAIEGVDAGFSLELAAAARVFVLLVPTAMLIAAVLMAVTVFARTYREAQSYAQPVFIVALVAGMAAISDIETGPLVALVPLVNVVMVVRDVLRGTATQTFLLAAFGANLLYATGAVIFAARVFESEQVLLGGERPWRTVWSRGARRPTPTGRGAVGFAVALVVLAFYGSTVAPRLGLAGQIVLVQVGILLVPALVFVAVGRFDVRQTLWLRWPSRRGAVGTLLVAVGAWSVGSVVVLASSALFGGTESYFDTLGETLAAATTGLGLLTTFALLALLPAISEEVCFRGVILSGLRSTGSAAGAVAGSAVLFGLFHISPFHIVPAAALGAVLATAVLLTRSIAVGVGGHAFANGLAVMALQRPDLVARIDHPVALVAGLSCTALGLALLATSRDRTEEAPSGALEASVQRPPA